MPADVAVRPAASFGGFPKQWDATSIPDAPTGVASGHLTLLTPDGRREVLVTVHRTTLEHFAVLYPATYSRVSCGARPLGVLNLRNTRVEPLSDDAVSPGTSGFVVRQRAPDAPNALTFLCQEDQDSWRVAFTWNGSPNSLHASSLPPVAEDEEF